jgi:hypothetical protein
VEDDNEPSSPGSGGRRRVIIVPLAYLKRCEILDEDEYQSPTLPVIQESGDDENDGEDNEDHNHGEEAVQGSATAASPARSSLSAPPPWLRLLISPAAAMEIRRRTRAPK